MPFVCVLFVGCVCTNVQCVSKLLFPRIIISRFRFFDLFCLVVFFRLFLVNLLLPTLQTFSGLFRVRFFCLFMFFRVRFFCLFIAFRFFCLFVIFRLGFLCVFMIFYFLFMLLFVALHLFLRFLVFRLWNCRRFHLCFPILLMALNGFARIYVCVSLKIYVSTLFCLCHCVSLSFLSDKQRKERKTKCNQSMKKKKKKAKAELLFFVLFEIFLEGHVSFPEFPYFSSQRYKIFVCCGYGSPFGIPNHSQ